jgi:two-component system, cell cycle sensor histidine kinase and response regulator CckA
MPNTPNEWFRTLVEFSPDALYVVRDGLIQFANPSALRLFGAERPEDLIGTPIMERVDPAYLDRAERRRAQVLEHGVAVPLERMRFRRLDGSPIDVEARAVPFDLPDGRHIFVALHDLTERRTLEEHLRQARKTEAVGRLAGGMAHEFNNTLAAILGHAEFALQQVTPQDPLHEDLLGIHQAAQRSAALTRRLLTFARRDAVDARVLDPDAAIATALDAVRPLLGADIALHWRPGVGTWPVRLDPAHVEQIVANLCLNARDAITGRGSITLTTDNVTVAAGPYRRPGGPPPGEYMRLVVRDDGHGMTADVAERAFEPFFTTKPFGQGTGLGLPMVHGIIEQAGGTISVTSAPGDGATFTIHLPKAADAAPSEAATVSTARVPRRAHVLVVEDSPAILRLATRALEMEGHAVHAAANATEAIALVESHAGPLDLVVSDIVMPDLHGPAMVERLRLLRPTLPALYISGFAADHVREHGLLPDGAPLLTKPFRLEDLGAQVRALLDA